MIHHTWQRQLATPLMAAGLLASHTPLAGHPLITEDTGTQGVGQWQLELTVDYGRSRSGVIRERSYSSAAVLSYGISATSDVIVTVPYERTMADGDGIRHRSRGPGDVELAAKMRFFERNHTSLAVRPGINLPTGDEREGLGSGRAAPSLFVVLSHEPGDWGFHFHIGYTLNRNVVAERRELYHGSVAATYRSSQQWQWVADLSAETNPDRSTDQHIRSAVFGVILSVRPNLDLDLGYRKGINGPAPDHAWLFGLAYRF